MKIIMIDKLKFILLYVIAIVGLLIGIKGMFFSADTEALKTIGEKTVKEFQIVTGEFKSKSADGKSEIEVYRWDPGTIVVNKGDRVRLRLYGVNGAQHSFKIPSFQVTGEVKRGQETIVEFTADQAGTHLLICTTHPDSKNEGPMIGYITVLDD
jgi:plastocyanin